ncbi:MAG: ABC transporter substrate-binding protein [Desulfobacterales bacterium RIFOXYA12_FULL_46_15]|nr:MAG: ABC transporter substrate-binding protein [Desulfobacula sp. GWF2_41_7]OGR26658.1 MAG: ABC transporter substrate-binding protein [Desulfobacterales bacterium RIFOXYA12_FULL_46_15]
MNIEKTKMGKISYINASPVYYGLDNGLLPDWLEMVPDVPSALNRKIMEGRIVISPISAAFYAMNHRELLLLPDLSISCHGRVMSVILVSRYSIDELTGKTVLLSRESASAASFLKMIFHQKNIAPVYQIGDVNNIESVSKNADAALIIGDTALTLPWHQQFNHCIDLGVLWYEMTHLPFVFAVWVVRRSFADSNPLLVKKIHALLMASKAAGYQHLDKIITISANKLSIEEKRIKEYFDLLFCDLNHEKIKAMGIFFDSLFDQGILTEKAEIGFFNPS